MTAQILNPLSPRILNHSVSCNTMLTRPSSIWVISPEEWKIKTKHNSVKNVVTLPYYIYSLHFWCITWCWYTLTVFVILSKSQTISWNDGGCGQYKPCFALYIALPGLLYTSFNTEHRMSHFRYRRFLCLCFVIGCLTLLYVTWSCVVSWWTCLSSIWFCLIVCLPIFRIKTEFYSIIMLLLDPQHEL